MNLNHNYVNDVNLFELLCTFSPVHVVPGVRYKLCPVHIVSRGGTDMVTVTN